MKAKLSQALHATLHQDIAQLMPEIDEGASAVLARRRLQAVADSSPLILTWLAEPWWAQDIEITLIHCARIHLYARILDDALDENLPVHRLLLLRAQALFWSSVGELAILHPQYWQQSTKLIYETVNAVEQDDSQSTANLWGLKNHHLLLIPLLLSNNSDTWQHSKSALSNLIWLMQVGDEWRQGTLDTKARKYQIIAQAELMMSDGIPWVLSQGGWKSAAERAVWECRQLLMVL
ncbi:hypothetical protein [Methylovulum psychrotolerans]|uniref:Uncharacterized protein n=1 Tax=Methylovulum psychrotolerans TaxID=1704499 RepID=A0A2S5CJ14_9GAMM|nr:hypothetical protein [Methylovulum psychrotolerans]POZ50732.1 hypothetical protein AADEFJLK_03629 [Methylovulum psychrotolerans]